MSEPTGPEVKPIPEKNPMRRWLIVGGIVAALLLVAGGIAWALWPDSEQDAREKALAEIEKKPPVVLPNLDESATPAPSADASSSGDATSGAGAGGAGSQPVVALSPYVAYRLRGKLWVVREDGAQPREVAASAAGPYSLSPDAKTLAWVEAKDAALYVVALAGGAPVKVGPAQPVMPVWMPDSSAVAYIAGTASAGEVWRADAKGAGARKVANGDRAAAGPKGEIVALALDEKPQVTVVSGTAAAKSFSAPLGARDVAVGAGALYFVVEGAEGGCEVWTAGLDGSGARRVATAHEGAKPADCGSLMLSPDGQRVVYAEIGDDGYSRMYSVPVSGGTPKLLSPRRDGYPLRWTSDGGSVLFIEGNPLQGETTALLRVRSDGAGRIVVMRDATG